MMEPKSYVLTLTTGRRVEVRYSDNGDDTFKVETFTNSQPTDSEVAECHELIDTFLQMLKYKPKTEWSKPHKA
jgi:hypothetical protein